MMRKQKINSKNPMPNTSIQYYFLSLLPLHSSNLQNNVLKVCSDGTYVFDGKCVKCQGVCKNHAPCNKSTGTCDNGCSDHWTGKFCEGTHTFVFSTIRFKIFKL